MLQEPEIIRRCQCGQPQMLELLIQRYETPLYTLCRKLTRDRMDADDLYQDTWVAAVRGLAGFSLERSFRAWLFAICLNRYRDLYRTRRRWARRVRRFFRGAEGGESDEGDARIASPEASPAERHERQARRDDVRQALDRLDDLHRLPLLLHYDRGLSIEEIAAALDVPAGTVKSRMATGRRKLREILTAGGEQEADV